MPARLNSQSRDGPEPDSCGSLSLSTLTVAVQVPCVSFTRPQVLHTEPGISVALLAFPGQISGQSQPPETLAAMKHGPGWHSIVGMQWVAGELARLGPHHKECIPGAVCAQHRANGPACSWPYQQVNGGL